MTDHLLSSPIRMNRDWKNKISLPQRTSSRVFNFQT